MIFFDSLRNCILRNTYSLAVVATGLQMIVPAQNTDLCRNMFIVCAVIVRTQRFALILSVF